MLAVATHFNHKKKGKIMMRKRLLSLILAACMLCALLPVGLPTAQAYSETDIAYPVEGGNIYFDKETGTITDCDEYVTAADIPAEIDGVAVTSIDEGAFMGCTNLTSIVLPDGVVSIGGCSSLTSVIIPDSVTNIMNSTFSDCSSLVSVTIPGSVTSIGYGAFYNCSSLTGLTIPYGVTSIDFNTFNGCSSLIYIIIPASVTSFGSSAFLECNSLRSVFF